MKQFILTGLLCILSTATTMAQPTWQWGKRGGGSYNSNQSGGLHEEVVDMATDQKGNLYVLSRVFANFNNINIDGNPITGRGFMDIAISSFKCNGAYRWTKLIGADDIDFATSIETDTLGGVYVTGQMYHDVYTAHIGNDTSLAASPQTLFLVKFDTLGAYQWVRRPQADTTYIINNFSTPLDIDVDDAGNVYWLSVLSPGLYVNGTYPVSAQSLHILKYNRQGSFLGGTQLAATLGGFPTYFRGLFMKRNHTNGKIYVTGCTQGVTGGTMSFGSTAITKSFFMGAFSSNGASIWAKQNAIGGLAGLNGSISRVSLDASGNIYVSGNAQHNDAFAGTTFYNALSFTVNKVAFAAKLDTGGNAVWVKNTSSEAPIAGNAPASVLSGNELILADAYGYMLQWPGSTDSLTKAPNTEYDIFITRLNTTTGALVKMDTISSGILPANEFATAMTVDRNGNAYVGGSFFHQMIVNGGTITNAGGYGDFFVAKYGTANCNCTVPTASYGKTIGANRTVTFNYFGAAVTHTYGGTASNFTACVTAYNSCGASNQSCQAVQFTVGIEGLSALGNIAVYPNPTHDALTIEGAEVGIEYAVLSLVGQVAQRGSVSGTPQSISLGAAPAGTYILMLTYKDGARHALRITKQ